MPCGERAVDDDFDGFIRRGGLAGSYDYDDISESYGFICDVYKTVLTRDLVQKFSLPDSTVLERLAEYMMDNSGNLNSPNNIANVLNANRVPTNHVTVGRYTSHLRDAFVFCEAKRYDIKGKKYLSTQAKHYVCDSGMRYAVLGTRDMDWGAHVRERGLSGADEARLRDLRREAVPKGSRLRREEGVGARLHPGE